MLGACGGWQQLLPLGFRLAGTMCAAEGLAVLAAESELSATAGATSVAGSLSAIAVVSPRRSGELSLVSSGLMEARSSCRRLGLIFLSCGTVRYSRDCFAMRAQNRAG